MTTGGGEGWEPSRELAGRRRYGNLSSASCSLRVAGRTNASDPTSVTFSPVRLSLFISYFVATSSTTSCSHVERAFGRGAGVDGGEEEMTRRNGRCRRVFDI